MPGHETTAAMNACATTRAPADSSGVDEAMADSAAEGSNGAEEAGGRRRRGRQKGRGPGRRPAAAEEDKRPAATLEEDKRPAARSIRTNSDRIQHSDGSAS